MDPRLAQDDVRHLREVVLHILNAVGPRDALARRSWPPEDGFVNPIGFSGHFFRKPERLEHFHGAAGDPVRLTDLQRSGFTLDDAGSDVRKCRHLRR